MALGDTADPAALPPIIGRLRDSKWWVRSQAAAAIRRLARDGVDVAEAAATLVRCLHHERQEVIEQAVAALAFPGLRERLLWSRATLMPLAGPSSTTPWMVSSRRSHRCGRVRPESYCPFRTPRVWGTRRTPPLMWPTR